MASIAESFSKILLKTGLTEADRIAFARHQDRVETCLQVRLQVSRTVVIGSCARGSAIRGTSDLDLLVLLHRSELRRAGGIVSPATALSRVRAALRQTFPTSAIGRDGQAVVVAFADKRKIDVVPAWYAGPLENGRPKYGIPSGGADWIGTAPDYHNKYIADGDARAGGKLKSVVRLLKFWRNCRASPFPLSAFHVELLLASEGTCHGAKSLAQCVAETLVLLAERHCHALDDPCGVSGPIDAAGTEAKRERLVDGVFASASRAVDAVNQDAKGNPKEARRLWGIVFNREFPS